MHVILVEKEILRLSSLRDNSSDDMKTFYNRLIVYLSGAGNEISNDLYNKIEKEIRKEN